jgi:hypothetical protein
MQMTKRIFNSKPLRPQCFLLRVLCGKILTTKATEIFTEKHRDNITIYPNPVISCQAEKVPPQDFSFRVLTGHRGRHNRAWLPCFASY